MHHFCSILTKVFVVSRRWTQSSWFWSRLPLVAVWSCSFWVYQDWREKGTGGRNLESERIKYVKNKTIMTKKENNWVQRKQKQHQERKMKGQADGEHKAWFRSSSSVPQDRCVCIEDVPLFINSREFVGGHTKGWEFPFNQHFWPLGGRGWS